MKFSTISCDDYIVETNYRFWKAFAIVLSDESSLTIV